MKCHDRKRTDDLLRPFVFFCLGLVSVSHPSIAAETLSIDKAHAAYIEGRFKDAAHVGESLRTSSGLALAAESLSIYAYYIAEDSEKSSLLKQAVNLANEAVVLDSKNANAHLQLARATGRYAQTVGSFRAASEGYAEQIRQSTENALQADPEMTAAHLSLGRWHAELVGTLGPFLARILYRARKKDAISAFERALELSPDSKVVTLEYALGMLAIDKDKNHKMVRELLVRSIGIPAKSAYERILHTQAVERLKLLDNQSGV